MYTCTHVHVRFLVQSVDILFYDTYYTFYSHERLLEYWNMCKNIIILIAQNKQDGRSCTELILKTTPRILNVMICLMINPNIYNSDTIIIDGCIR